MGECEFRDLAHGLRSAYFAMRGRMDDILAMGSTRGLRMDDALVIAALQRHGPMPVERLSVALGRNLSSVSRQLGSMESRRLIEKRARAEDRRIVDIHLTHAAGLQAAEVCAKASQIHNRLVHGLSLIEQRELVRMLRIVAANGPGRECR